MLVPPAILWRGINTRGPIEQPCSSGSSGIVFGRGIYRVADRNQRILVSSIKPAASFRLARKRPKAPGARSDKDQFAGGTNSESGEIGAVIGEDVGGDVRIRPSTPKVLQINIDILLWRCRNSRIQAGLTLDAAERKSLYKDAEDGLRRCLALDPSDARAYVVLGKALVRQKRYGEARVLYQEGCVNTGNMNPYIWASWGWLEALMGNAERARKLYDAAIVVDGTHACAWHKWGMLEKMQGNYTRARDLWMKGIQQCRRKPESSQAYLYNGLACMAAQLGRVGEARAWFEEGTSTAEGAASVALWQAWAVLEAKLGDPTAVRYLFKRALEANSKSRYVYLAWALWEKHQGNPQQCLALLQRGIQFNRTDPALYQAWALVEKEAGRIDRARELFEQGLKADHGHQHLWQAYGIMEAEQGNLDRARQLFQEGVWADPRSNSTVFLFHAWGSVEYRAGSPETARELFKAAIRIDPKNDVTWNTWIEMESDLGFVERADELRIRRTEQQWEFVVPAGFTTRPAPGLLDTLSRFFSLRGFGRQQSASGTNATAPSSATGKGASGPLSTLVSNGTFMADRMGLEEIEKMMQPGDVSSLPDFMPLEEEEEAALMPSWRPRNAHRSAAAATTPAGTTHDADPGSRKQASENRTSLQSTEMQSEGVSVSPARTPGLAPRPVTARRRGQNLPNAH